MQKMKTTVKRGLVLRYRISSLFLSAEGTLECRSMVGTPEESDTEERGGGGALGEGRRARESRRQG